MNDIHHIARFVPAIVAVAAIAVAVFGMPFALLVV